MGDSFDVSREPMLEMFIFETNQLLEQLEEILLDSEKGNSISAENINEIFRIMHTIKGSAAMMMFNNISSIAHAVEDLFYFIRENKPKDINYSIVCDIVLETSDFVKTEISKVEEGKDSDGNADNLSEKIKEFLSDLNGDFNIEDSKKSKQTNENVSKKFYISSCKDINDVDNKNEKNNGNLNKCIAKIFFEADCQMENIRAYTIIHNIKEFCTDLHHLPKDVIEDETSCDYISKNGFEIYLSTYKSEEEVNKILQESLFVKSCELSVVESYQDKLEDINKQIEDDKSKDEHKEENKEQREGTGKAVKQNLISVNINKLDKLMDLVGEIVITESMVTRNPDLVGLELENFNKAARQLRKLNDELQDIVMSIRMVPIATTFHKMHRIVRDMSKKLNKEVELVIIGEETEVDKNIIDNLSDPLMHLIRNSMDHGIEDVEERKQTGKPLEGKITLEAKNTGGDVLIIISDDGRGLNKEKILKKARENGLISRPESDLTEREIFSFILLPGFSTKENVTEFSGRGVGMDVVKKNIEKVGGSIYVDSVPQIGTTITIKIPLTLAIVNGMEVRVGKSKYTIPTVSIKESFKAKEEDSICDSDGNEMIMLRGECAPVIRLHKAFGVKTDINKVSDGIIIMVENDEKTACLFADELLGEQQVVVKGLPKYFKKINGIAGCTILGDGSISLIIDIPQMISKVIV